MPNKKAEQPLLDQGFRITKRNFTCRMGEIDLIAEKSNLLIFVEVRCRNNQHYGSGAESVTYHKQRKIIKTANYYLQINANKQNMQCRFDVIDITHQDKKPKIVWIADAFQVSIF